MSLVKDIRTRALSLSSCDCGWIEPSERRFEAPFIVYYYRGFENKRIPINKHCVHRKIEKALISMYKLGRRRRNETRLGDQ